MFKSTFALWFHVICFTTFYSILVAIVIILFGSNRFCFFSHEKPHMKGRIPNEIGVRKIVSNIRVVRVLANFTIGFLFTLDFMVTNFQL